MIISKNIIIPHIVWNTCVVIIGSTLIIGMLCFIHKYITKSWALRKFRGPYALPLVGNCYNPNSFSLFRYMADQKRRYGKTFLLYLFHKTYLVTVEPAILRKLFSDPKTFAKCDNYKQLSSLILGDGLATSTHQTHRYLYSQFFSFTNISISMPLLCDTTNQTITELLQPYVNPTSSSTTTTTTNNSIDIQLLFSRLALRQFLKYCCNYSYNNSEREIEICKLISSSSSALATVLMYSIPHWDFIPLVTTAKRVRKEVLKDFLVLIRERRETIRSQNLETSQTLPDCLTTLILSDLSDTQIFDHIFTMMCSAHDTVAYTVSFVCLLLAENPATQDRLRCEVFETLGNRKDLKADEVIGMRYLNQVIQETLRLYSILPCITRVTTCSVTIKDSSLSGDSMTIPENTDVLVPLYLVNRDPTLWLHPSKFMPERFDGKVDFSFASYGYFPFGSGSSECMGKIFAHVEIALMLCTLLREYKFLPDPTYRVSITAGIYLATTNGVRVRVEKL